MSTSFVVHTQSGAAARGGKRDRSRIGRILPAGRVETHRLGNSDLLITVLGFGSWAVGGGDWEFGWGAQDDAQSISAIHRALDLGVNWIDTAPVYGLGRSEEVVGRALAGRSRKPYVFTKCSMRWDAERKIYRSLRAASVREEVEASLRRLDVDVIDLCQIHWPNPDPEIEEGWAALAALVGEGKIRHIGVSNFNVAQVERARAIAPVTSVQPPYSAIRRDAERELLPYCERHGIGVIVYAPMQSGLLAGAMTKDRVAALPADDWRRRGSDFQEPGLTRNLRLADLMAAIGARHGHGAGAVAIAWALRLPAVTAAIVGARSAAQVGGFIAAASFRLSASEIAEIDSFLAENPVRRPP
jgi:aryl-alcohol dehydrogenase-like predicted oxidoreductase